MLDPKMRSTAAAVVRRHASSAPTRSSPRRRRPASSTTTRRSRACRRSTATRCGSSSTAPDYDLLSNLTTVGDGGGRARGGRGVRRRERLGDGQSGRHRALPAQGVAARRRRSCSRRIPASATSLYPREQRPRRPRDRREARGKQAAADRPHRDQHHRGSRIRACSRSSSGELDYLDGAGRSRRRTCSTPDNRLKPRFAQAGRHARARHPAGDHATRTSTWRTRSSAATRRSKIALRRAIGMAYNVDEEIRVIRAGAGGAGDAADAAERDRPRPEVQRPRASTIRPAREGAARQVRLRRPRQGRLARPARRQAARAEDRRTRRRRRSTASTTSCGSAA